MFFCNDREIFHSDGLTRRPPVTLPPAKRKLISAPDKDKCQRADTVQATTCTCLHASALYANQCLTMCIHSASTCLHLSALAYTKCQPNYNSVQTQCRLFYTLSTLFFPLIISTLTTKSAECRQFYKKPSVQVFHRYLHICTPTHLRAQRAPHA